MLVNVAVEGRPAVLRVSPDASAVWVEHTARMPAADYRSAPEPLLDRDGLLEALVELGEALDLPETWACSVPVHLGRPPVTFAPPASDFLADCLRAAVLNAIA